MDNSIFVNDASMPAELKNAAKSGLPVFLETELQDKLNEASILLSKAFGDSGDFTKLIEAESETRNKDEQSFITRFQKNLKLLVQKTWVDKSDETLKEEILYRISSMVETLESKNYKKSLSEFLPILKDVIVLLFGNLAKQESFFDYAVRIDPDFGFFWFYINSIQGYANWSDEKSRLAVLLGICFLSNF